MAANENIVGRKANRRGHSDWEQGESGAGMEIAQMKGVGVVEGCERREKEERVGSR